MNNMKKLLILKLGYILNWCILIINICNIISNFTLQITGNETILSNVFDSLEFNLVYTSLAPICIAYWIWLLVIWGKKDKKISRFFLLFFLNFIYSSVYYRIIVKNRWLVS